MVLFVAIDAAAFPDDVMAVAAVVTTVAAKGNGTALPAALVTVHPAVLVSASAPAVAAAFLVASAMALLVADMTVFFAANATTLAPAVTIAATSGPEPPPDPS